MAAQVATAAQRSAGGSCTPGLRAAMVATPMPAPAPENRGLCGQHRPGSFAELTPHEFDARREMGVVVLKVPDAAARFGGFRHVFALDCSAAVESALAGWPREAPLGVVCADGECSSRVAIRLSRQGYRVFHLAGGLREWQRSGVL